ncbi:5-formyltetrahydrofolate cyclo-ligase [Algoriphagus vanfongensis]|uniref:5-formyltetrahydrofolate cyclo-ligase n=1 Tax=Algoriphagus vanfongensis TaxID=426371 RepID=UPI0003F9C894|nr:5-formyltetrahydrofolate cyclo-ligase [Algoriphagus vanfongensis]
MTSVKDQIRQEYKKRRRQLSDEEAARLSQQVCERAKSFLEDRNELKRIHIFLPIASQREVDTFPLLDFLWANGYDVSTSLVDPASGDLKTVSVPAGVTFHYDSWGIPIPSIFENKNPEELELIFVPLLAYDLYGMRIGFGKGYYDRFFSSLQNLPVKVGMSFFEPEGRLPAESHDIPLDFCITPIKVLTF